MRGRALLRLTLSLEVPPLAAKIYGQPITFHWCRNRTKLVGMDGRLMVKLGHQETSFSFLLYCDEINKTELSY